MDSKDLRKDFLFFFEKKGHKIVPSSSLIPTDPSVLFTTAGMQQFKPYYLGEKSPYGERVASCQKCFRTSDIDEVGDKDHLTFLEMLGNFSFGDYFKTEAIKLAYEFLFKKLRMPLGSAVFTVFAGDKDKDVPEDKESIEIWKRLGIPENKIKKYGKEDNFWGPTGEQGPCGPNTEIHIQGTEVWNLVFNEYYQDRDKKLTPLEQKGVDTGMGLERLAMVVQNKPSVFETDLFEPILREIPDSNVKTQRIIADHIKGAVFLISEGILPSNIERGSILRKIIRGASDAGRILRLSENFLIPLAQKVMEIYKETYPDLKSKETDILTVIQNEEEDYRKSEVARERIAQKLITKSQEGGSITGAVAYDIFSTTRIGIDRIKELAGEQGIKLTDPERFFSREREFRGISRAGAEKKFGGGGKFSPELHTATHLLHAALRKILGEHVKQMGSDITSERLRFDFSHPQKMTGEEIKKVEDLVNQKIEEDLEIKKEKMSYEKAVKTGALAFFKEKYPRIVTVYSADDFSKEICGGPHVKRTSELGKFKIIKEESCGAGTRRIRAILT
ncbi:hypothetical protein AMJ48_02680 [Parcubacteria bacterium DG_74_1]|nr:MAG: hypothetical protein AMJ48_02680 [Parcubacteria bacterium DG_74_1]